MVGSSGHSAVNSQVLGILENSSRQISSLYNDRCIEYALIILDPDEPCLRNVPKQLQSLNSPDGSKVQMKVQKLGTGFWAGMLSRFWGVFCRLPCRL